MNGKRWVASVVLAAVGVGLWAAGLETASDRWEQCVSAADGTDASLRACDTAYTAETGIELRFMLDSPK